MLLWIRLSCREGVRRKDVCMVHLNTPEDALFQTNDSICLLPKLSSVWAWNFSQVVKKIGAEIWRMLLDLGLFILVVFFPGASRSSQLPSAHPSLRLSSLGSSGMSSVLVLYCSPQCQGCLHPQGPCRIYLCKWQDPIYDSLSDVSRCGGLTGSLVVLCRCQRAECAGW